MGASDMGFGGLPLLQPSQTCTRYLRNSTQVVEEKEIRIGARYRTRKNLAEHVRGYRLIKRGLQRKLAEIEHDRKNAHFQLPEMSSIVCDTIRTAVHTQVLPRPVNSCSFFPSYTSKCPLFKKHVSIGNTEPRMEHIIGMVDIRRKLMKNPSEKLLDRDPDPLRDTQLASAMLGITKWK